jgi:hypothetical protein
MAVTLAGEVCRQLGAKTGDKRERITAEFDPPTGRLRLTLVQGGDWGLRWKDGCAAVHIPLDHLTAAPSAQPARPAIYELESTERRVVVTLPDWAAPGRKMAAPVAPPPPEGNSFSKAGRPPLPQSTAPRPMPAPVSGKQLDESAAEALIRGDRERWHARAIADEFGWPLGQASSFVLRIRTKIDSEKADAAEAAE